ncbi:MAG: hypothetical protein INR69_01390 [Mucilaginibacter polytrichastri]|nr:hypothetical protein [Mucilaginibacter polytrichastri]
MNRPVIYSGIVGGMLVIGGALSPMLHISVVGNWNYFKIEPVLATTACLAAAIGILGAVFTRENLVRYCGWFILGWISFTLFATIFKVNDYFAIIPFKKLARWMSTMITFRYAGWIAIYLGALLMIFLTRKSVTTGDKK